MEFLFDAGAMTFFQCGPMRLMIGTSENSAIGAGTILYFTVKDLQETCALLDEKKISFIAPPHCVAKMPDHDLWLALFKDPDGNTLGIMSEVPRAGN